MKAIYFLSAALASVTISTAAFAAGPMVMPGLWVTAMQMQMSPNANIPPQAMAQMARPRVTKTCITPAKALQFSTEGFGQQAMARRNCTKSGLGYIGGHIDMTMICHEREGMMTVHMTGSYTPTSSHMVSDMTGTMMHGPMIQKMTIDSHRIGDCSK
jgi:hypothetical protein